MQKLKRAFLLIGFTILAFFINSPELHQKLIIIITPFEEEFHKPENSGKVMTCFGIALFLMVLSSLYFQNQPYNPIPLSVCLILGAVAMIISKVITINEAYRAVNWRTVFLLGGLIPLGMAVDQTGTAEWIAKGIVAGMGPYMKSMPCIWAPADTGPGITLKSAAFWQ